MESRGGQTSPLLARGPNRCGVQRRQTAPPETVSPALQEKVAEKAWVRKFTFKRITKHAAAPHDDEDHLSAVAAGGEQGEGEQGEWNDEEYALEAGGTAKRTAVGSGEEEREHGEWKDEEYALEAGGQFWLINGGSLQQMEDEYALEAGGQFWLINGGSLHQVFGTLVGSLTDCSAHRVKVQSFEEWPDAVGVSFRSFEPPLENLSTHELL
ncbi:hypothetical protein T484DRAFT_1789430 [Baffinella frigidus]|nr:hypothetical protein T484DRAFT_1789430 [Cryptophyta sp. CCMP2293]